MNKKKIGIIGHFGGNENILDGQTIKTKILYDELQKSTNWDLIKVDTYYKTRNPAKLILDTLRCLGETKDVIVLLSRNGMKFYFPLLYFYIKITRIRVYHDVIGGNLNTYIEKYPKFIKYLNSFKKNWVETDGLKNKLERQGIMNCEVIPNFKRLHIAEVKETKYEAPFKFCIFSRVMKEKGIEVAIAAVESINFEAGKKVCQLDIYGKIDDSYKQQFEKIMKVSSDAVIYKGTVSYEKSVEVIKEYYALLFPTYWDGEGFPGTIIDAFSAGLPVIATDWNCNSEIVENKKNGILYPNTECKDLKSAIQWLISHKNSIAIMKRNCVESAKQYQPDKYIKQIVEEIKEY